MTYGYAYAYAYAGLSMWVCTRGVGVCRGVYVSIHTRGRAKPCRRGDKTYAENYLGCRAILRRFKERFWCGVCHSSGQGVKVSGIILKMRLCGIWVLG